MNKTIALTILSLGVFFLQPPVAVWSQEPVNEPAPAVQEPAQELASPQRDLGTPPLPPGTTVKVNQASEGSSENTGVRVENQINKTQLPKTFVKTDETKYYSLEDADNWDKGLTALNAGLQAQFRRWQADSSVLAEAPEWYLKMFEGADAKIKELRASIPEGGERAVFDWERSFFNQYLTGKITSVAIEENDFYILPTPTAPEIGGPEEWVFVPTAPALPEPQAAPVAEAAPPADDPPVSNRNEPNNSSPGNKPLPADEYDLDRYKQLMENWR